MIDKSKTFYFKTTPKGRIHITHKGTSGGYNILKDSGEHHVPKRDVYYFLCSGSNWHGPVIELNDKRLIQTDGPATCLHCLKKAGLVKEEESDIRYVLYDKKEKKYYKKHRWQYRTVDHMFSATFYQVRHAAERAGEVVRHYDSSGNQISREEYSTRMKIAKEQRIKPDVEWRCEFNDERYEIKKIKLSIDPPSEG